MKLRRERRRLLSEGGWSALVMTPSHRPPYGVSAWMSQAPERYCLSERGDTGDRRSWVVGQEAQFANLGMPEGLREDNDLERSTASGFSCGHPPEGHLEGIQQMTVICIGHLEWRCGLPLIAAEGGAGRRPAQRRGRADQSIARSAPLGLAAPLPPGRASRSRVCGRRPAGEGSTHPARGYQRRDSRRVPTALSHTADLGPARRTAELASEAARAEGASPPTTASRRGLRRWQRVSGRRRAPPAPGPARVLGWSGRCGWHGRPGGAGRAAGGRPGGGGRAGRGG
jgi:hypothetical protein